MWKNLRAVSDLYMLLDICIWSYLYILAEFGVWVNCCKGMNVCHFVTIYILDPSTTLGMTAALPWQLMY